MINLKMNRGHAVARAARARAWLLAGSAMLAISALSQGALAQTYTYDDLGRVTKVVYPDGGQLDYVYDIAGNRTQLVRTAGGNIIQVTAVANLKTLAGFSGSTPGTYNFLVPSGTNISGADASGNAIDTDTAWAGSSLALTVAGSVANPLNVRAPINVTVTGSLYGGIKVATGTTLGLTGVGQSLTGNSATVNLTGTGSSMTMTGDTNTISAAPGNVVTVQVVPTDWSQADNVSMSSGTLKINPNTHARLTGTGNTVNIGSGSSVSITGNDTLTSPGGYANGGYYSTFFSTGTNNSFLNTGTSYIAGSSIYFNTAGMTGAVNGFNNSITAASGNVLTISSPNASWDYANNLDLSSGTVNLTANSFIRLAGTNTGTTINITSGGGVSLATGGNTVSGGTASSPTYIYAGGSSSTPHVLTTNGANLILTANNLYATVTGHANTVDATAVSAANITVNQDSVNWSDAGQVNMSHGTLNVSANSRTRLDGSINTVAIGANGVLGSASLANSTLSAGTNSLVYANGDHNVITAASGANINVTNPTWNWGVANDVTFTGSTGTLTVGASSLAHLWGNGSSVVIGAGSQIGIYGTGITVTRASGSSGGNTIYLNKNTNGNAFTVDAQSSTVILNDANPTATVTGNGNTINLTGGTLHVSGTSTVNATSTSVVYKTSDVVTVNGTTNVYTWN